MNHRFLSMYSLLGCAEISRQSGLSCHGVLCPFLCPEDPKLDLPVLWAHLQELDQFGPIPNRNLDHMLQHTTQRTEGGLFIVR